MTVYGRAGGSLDDADFAASAEAARVGQVGEVLTATILNKLAAQHGFTVLHDLRIPGSKANIDHVVVSADRVRVIDSKMWKPGFYWTLRGKTRRGSERVPHADKRGIPFGHERLEALLEKHGARMQRPLMVIHSSRPGSPISIWAFRPASTPRARVRAIKPEALSFPGRPADARIVAALTHLIN